MLRLILIALTFLIFTRVNANDIVDKHKDSYIKLWEILCIIVPTLEKSEGMPELSAEESSTIKLLSRPDQIKLLNKIFPIFMAGFPYEGYLFQMDRRDLNRKRYLLNNVRL